MVSFWILCPLCGEKTRLKVTDETVVIRLPLYCPKCRRETTVDIKKGIVTKSHRAIRE